MVVRVMGVRNDVLQSLCRSYLSMLRHMGRKHGIDVDSLIRMNRRGECSATEHECRMLARLCDDERIERCEIPSFVGKSYRKCVEEGVFSKIRRLPHVGIYDKISVLLLRKR